MSTKQILWYKLKKKQMKSHCFCHAPLSSLPAALQTLQVLFILLPQNLHLPALQKKPQDCAATEIMNSSCSNKHSDMEKNYKTKKPFQSQAVEKYRDVIELHTFMGHLLLLHTWFSRSQLLRTASIPLHRMTPLQAQPCCPLYSAYWVLCRAPK